MGLEDERDSLKHELEEMRFAQREENAQWQMIKQRCEPVLIASRRD